MNTKIKIADIKSKIHSVKAAGWPYQPKPYYFPPFRELAEDMQWLIQNLENALETIENHVGQPQG